MENTHIISEILKDLKSVSQDLQLLSDKVGNIAAEIGEITNNIPTGSKKITRSPVRKKITFENGVVHKIKRVPSTRIIHDIILKSVRGVDAKTLMKKTGYNQRKIHNITFRLKNQGKIRSVGHGVYGKI